MQTIALCVDQQDSGCAFSVFRPRFVTVPYIDSYGPLEKPLVGYKNFICKSNFYIFHDIFQRDTMTSKKNS